VNAPARRPRKQATSKTTQRRQTRREETEAEQNGSGIPAGVAIPDQAAFAAALGLDPQFVVRNSVHVEFDTNGVALVRYSAFLPVTPQELAMAFVASAGIDRKSVV